MNEIYYEPFQYSEPGSVELARVICYDRIGGANVAHWHKAFEITLPDKGGLILNLGREEHIISEGDISYVNSDIVHSTCVYPRGSYGKGLVVLISEEMLKTACPEYNKYRFEIPPGDPGRKDLIKVMRELYACKLNPSPYDQAKVNSLLWGLCHILLTRFLVPKDETQISAQGDDYLARKAMGYIDENFRQDLTLANVAAQVGLQENYFCRYFKKYVGMSFTQYLSQVRLRYALAYMLDFDASIVDSALQAGFPSARSMTDCCRKVYGVTPAQYRAGETAK